MLAVYVEKRNCCTRWTNLYVTWWFRVNIFDCWTPRPFISFSHILPIAGPLGHRKISPRCQITFRFGLLMGSWYDLRLCCSLPASLPSSSSPQNSKTCHFSWSIGLSAQPPSKSFPFITRDYRTHQYPDLLPRGVCRAGLTLKQYLLPDSASLHGT